MTEPHGSHEAQAQGPGPEGGKYRKPGPQTFPPGHSQAEPPPPVPPALLIAVVSPPHPAMITTRISAIVHLEGSLPSMRHGKNSTPGTCAHRPTSPSTPTETRRSTDQTTNARRISRRRARWYARVHEMDAEIAIACDLNAFDREVRKRYTELRAQVQGAVLEIRELADGFMLRVAAEPSLLAAVGEWIALERRCCPFLDFAVEIPHGDTSAWLRISGPEGTKEILREGCACRS